MCLDSPLQILHFSIGLLPFLCISTSIDFKYSEASPSVGVVEW